MIQPTLLISLIANHAQPSLYWEIMGDIVLYCGKCESMCTCVPADTAHLQPGSDLPPRIGVLFIFSAPLCPANTDSYGCVYLGEAM